MADNILFALVFGLVIFIFIGIVATAFNTVADAISPTHEELNETENWYGFNEGEIWYEQDE